MTTTDKNPSDTCIDSLLHRNIGETVDDIVSVFNTVRKRPVHDLFDTEGIHVLKRNIDFFVRQDAPVLFLLPAFPCKSPNTTDKVLGTLPDMAEAAALDHLGDFCSRIKSTYAPGCNLLIFADGRIYADIVGVDDTTMSSYLRHLRKMCQSPHISWSCLDNFFPEMSPDAMRIAVVSTYGTSLDQLKDVISSDHDKRNLYCALSRFLIEDRIWPVDRSRTSIQKECKANALIGMQRNDAYGRMIKLAYPNHIRLSIHPHSNAGEKFGITLLPGDHGWGTPWHGVLVVRTDGGVSLMKRREAAAAGYTMVYTDGRPSHFVECDDRGR